MKRIIIYTALVFTFTACTNQRSINVQSANSTANQITNNMRSYVSIFEIPAIDFLRAVEFYQSILDIKIEQIDMPDMQMGLFPYEDQMVFGSIIKGEDYKPSANGVTIYLNGGNNLQSILDKVVVNGGEIIVPKTLHSDESGYFALFLDSEGNRIGLHSPN